MYGLVKSSLGEGSARRSIEASLQAELGNAILDADGCISSVAALAAGKAQNLDGSAQVGKHSLGDSTQINRLIVELKLHGHQRLRQGRDSRKVVRNADPERLLLGEQELACRELENSGRQHCAILGTTYRHNATICLAPRNRRLESHCGKLRPHRLGGDFHVKNYINYAMFSSHSGPNKGLAPHERRLAGGELQGEATQRPAHLGNCAGVADDRLLVTFGMLEARHLLIELGGRD